MDYYGYTKFYTYSQTPRTDSPLIRLKVITFGIPELKFKFHAKEDEYQEADQQLPCEPTLFTDELLQLPVAGKNTDFPLTLEVNNLPATPFPI